MKAKRVIGWLAGMLLPAVVAMAGSPAQVTGTVAVAGSNLTVPASGSVAFKLEAIVFDRADASAGGWALTTQTVSLVHGPYTNQLTTKAVTATDGLLLVTNAPWQFAGDKVRITTTATNAAGVKLIGVTGD
jgi:hypothetical protein